MFKPVSPKVDFSELERRLLEWWYASGVVKKYLEKNMTAPNRFSFLDGPITANNPMGVHHAWGRTYKDLWQRFFNMRGYRQRFQNGFDNQGLWVEVEVEKGLGFKNKKDIEKYGIDKFVEKCKEHTMHFANIQTEQSKRLGYFMDWENSYYTMSEENNYMIWHFLKKCHEENLIYKGKDSVPWCPRCGTAISQHEILTEEYKELTHTSVFLKYPRLGFEDNSYFLVWTTTPWTIPANVALAVNPEEVYGEFEVVGSGETLIFMKKLAEKVLAGKQYGIKKKYVGSELAGQHYAGPYDRLPRVQKAKEENTETFHSIITDKDFVSAEEGTGIVHTAPGVGAEDFALGKKVNLPVIEAIDESADYLEGFGDLTGQSAKEQPELIFDYLREGEDGRFLFKLEDYTHRYPICWRCKTELVWRVVDEWYLSMDQLRYKIMEVSRKVNWLPKWGLERELDWLKNMGDWLISKKRYWGLALPIWECLKCGNFEVLGNRDELKERAVEGWEKFEGHTPHKPWVDEVKIKCSKCGELASRVPDVGNPWLDAGIVPFSTLGYRTQRDSWKEWFPADFITESFPGQFKNWFYSLLTMSTVLEKTNPFKTVLGHATVKDEKGEEMHKSKGNAIEFIEAAEKMGVDVMRWIYVRQNSELNLNFGYGIADETRRRFHLILWNIYNFFVTYANLDRWEEGKVGEASILDKWILSRMHQMIGAVTESLLRYDAFTASGEIEEFVNDLSTWYVRRSRDRVGPTVEEGPDKLAFYQTMNMVLVTLVKILAPFIPFITEEVYKNLTQKESVHLADWPEKDKALVDSTLEEQMALVRKICEQAHALRKKEGIKVRQPLSKLVYKGRLPMIKLASMSLPSELASLIASEVNVKEVILGAEKGEFAVELDMVLTPELEVEGKAREIVRQIQEARKEKGLALDEKIRVVLPDYPEMFEDYLCKETLAEHLEKGPFEIRKVTQE